MSTHKPGLDASELLDDDGTVDHSVIKSLTNASVMGSKTITTDMCDAFRRDVATGKHASTIAEEYDVGDTTLRKHVRGECHHAEAGLNEPPASYTTGEGWRVEE